MDRKEAAEMIQDDIRKHHDYLSGKYRKALRMAIEALSKPNYESDTEVRLAVTDRNKDKVVLWDAFGEVEYYPHGDMYCPNCGARLVPENEYLEPTQTHRRLIDADALSKKLCETTIFIKDGEVFQRMINDAPTLQADRPHGEWTPVTEQLPKIDETLSLCDQISDEVLGTDTHGNIRHVYLTNCGYLKPTFCTVEEGMSVDIVAWMPTPEPYEEGER